MTTTDTKNTRTITLTDRPPVRIVEDNWPIVAHGRYHEYDNAHESQANRTTDINIHVRQHEDGRAIVYGVDDYDTAFQNERGWTNRAGVLLEQGADLVSAIHNVATTLIDHEGSEAAHIRGAARDCIADLPAEVI